MKRELDKMSNYMMTDELIAKLKEVCHEKGKEDGRIYDEESFIAGFGVAIFMSEIVGG